MDKAATESFSPLPPDGARSHDTAKEESPGHVHRLDNGGEPPRIAVIARRVSAGPPFIADSTEHPCCRCKRPVWLSPSTVRRHRRLDWVLCLECAVEIAINRGQKWQVSRPNLDQQMERDAALHPFTPHRRTL